MERDSRSCANCGVYHCDHLDSDWPSFCMTTRTPREEFDEAVGEYLNDPWTSKVFKAAAEIEGLYYGKLTRVEEVCLFAKKIGAKRIGIACCRGLIKDAQLFAKVLRAKGFEDVCAVMCKVGGVDKTETGIPEGVKVRPGAHESACNPIAQARLLAERGTDLNVIVGLCVGHDTLFIKHSEAPVTYLIVKDRVLAHNPAGALHAMDTYYRRLLDPDLPEPRPCEE